MKLSTSCKKLGKNGENVLKIKVNDKKQQSTIESTVVKNLHKDSRSNRENFNFMKAKQSLNGGGPGSKNTQTRP